MTAPPSTPFHVRRAAGDLLLPAAERLARASSGLDGAGEQLLAAARLHAISFRYFWASTSDPVSDEARQACLMVPGAGRTGMCFTTRPETDTEADELGAVIEHACRAIPSKTVRLAQALLEPDEAGLIRAHEAGGMPPISTLLYLRRPLPQPGELVREELPDDVEVTRYRPGKDDPALLDALPRTYEGTLDCPELSGVRRPADVVASHRAAGAWSPDLWSLIWHRGRVEGVVLMNPMPDQDGVELVYYGLTPVLRGRGLGRVLLHNAAASLAGRHERTFMCACDVRNAPALHVYEKLGMREAERRVALVRVIGAPPSGA